VGSEAGRDEGGVTLSMTTVDWLEAILAFELDQWEAESRCGPLRSAGLSRMAHSPSHTRGQRVSDKHPWRDAGYPGCICVRPERLALSSSKRRLTILPDCRYHQIAAAHPHDHRIPWNCPTFYDGCNCETPPKPR
jgi:hypothetical protein